MRMGDFCNTKPLENHYSELKVEKNLQINKKKTANPKEKQAKGLNKLLPKEDINMA